MSKACLRLQFEEAKEIATHIVTQLTATSDTEPGGPGQPPEDEICRLLIDNRRKSSPRTSSSDAAAVTLSLKEQLINCMCEDVEGFFRSKKGDGQSTSASTADLEGDSLFDLLSQKYDFESLSIGIHGGKRSWIFRSKLPENVYFIPNRPN